MVRAVVLKDVGDVSRDLKGRGAAAPSVKVYSRCKSSKGKSEPVRYVQGQQKPLARAPGARGSSV